VKTPLVSALSFLVATFTYAEFWIISMIVAGAIIFTQQLKH